MWAATVRATPPMLCRLSSPPKAVWLYRRPEWGSSAMRARSALAATAVRAWAMLPCRQQAVLVFSVHVFGVDARWQRDAAREATVFAFAVGAIAAGFLLLFTFLTPDRQRVAGDVDLHVFGLDARQFESNGDFLIVF